MINLIIGAVLTLTIQKLWHKYNTYRFWKRFKKYTELHATEIKEDKNE